MLLEFINRFSFKIAGSFVHNDAEINVGPVYILVELPVSLRSFEYQWRYFNEMSMNGWDAVQILDPPADKSACVLLDANGSEVLGEINFTAQSATAAVGGHIHTFSANPLFAVLCRRPLNNIH